MCSSVIPSSSLSFSGNTRFINHRFNFNSSYPYLINHFRPRNSKTSPSSSISLQNLEVSWVPPNRNVKDDFNGWAVDEAPIDNKKKIGLPTFVLVGVGTSVVALLAVSSYFSLSRKGFSFCVNSPFHASHGVFMPSGTNKATESKSMDSDALSMDMVSEASPESVSDMANDALAVETSHSKREGQIIIPVAVDCNQQEALLVLKKLKIIEDDVKVDILCTRREYARWLAQANLLLERNRKHQIVPSIALSGSTISAFEDVSVDDPDFIFIQSLAEAGIVLSKLSHNNASSALEDSKNQGANFFPERFISHQDLISWKAKLDYEVMPGINEEVSRNNLGFMDAREISSDALVVLFMDLQAGDKSIIRTVFGQGKRFQPNKPSTKAQAAVALTRGRMAVAIQSELSSLEAEYSSRQMAMDEVRSELLERGDIQKYWDEKLKEEKSHGVEVERDYISAVQDFQQEKIVQEHTLAEHLKEKAAIDCQKQLLSSLKEEVNEMSEKLECERAKYVNEQQSIQYMSADLQVQYDELLDAKSILEAEIEALRILRSWIEDEARKSQARAKVLEEAGRRWKWDERA